jgi:hypothetical protein
MRLPLNQPWSIFLLVLSILAVVLAIALFESGHTWLFHRSPSISLWVPGAVAVGYVVLRMILKRL